MPSSSVPDSTAAAKPPGHARAIQAERRTRTRAACSSPPRAASCATAAATSCSSRYARDAGLTRGALCHLFDGKDDLALASVDWLAATWDREVGEAVDGKPDAAAALLTLACCHAVFCPRNIARAAIPLPWREELVARWRGSARAA